MGPHAWRTTHVCLLSPCFHLEGSELGINNGSSHADQTSGEFLGLAGADMSQEYAIRENAVWLIL